MKVIDKYELYYGGLFYLIVKTEDETYFKIFNESEHYEGVLNDQKCIDEVLRNGRKWKPFLEEVLSIKDRF